ncbi:hypothetical protein HYV21_02155 [Candidatus Microgenomates bacterium]|nr:hypothetical protein [Candidatus Microgenomates bacterium]
MRKEVLIAILLGATLGLAIAFGVYRANLALRSTPTTTQATPAPTSAPSSSTLTITQPEDEALVDTDSITVEGKTAPNATVVITSPVDEVTALADNSGTFRAEVKLEPGANALLVTSFGEDNNSVEKELTITYSTEFKKE